MYPAELPAVEIGCSPGADDELKESRFPSPLVAGAADVKFEWPASLLSTGASYWVSAWETDPSSDELLAWL